MTNEIEFFSTSQKEVFLSLANKLIEAYNMQGENKINTLTDANIRFFQNETHPLKTLIRKLEHIIFSKGDPLSVKPFLSRILKGEKHHGKPGTRYNKGHDHLEDVYVGKGHFEWDHSAIVLDERSLNAVKIVLSNTKEFSSKTEFLYNGILVTSELYKSGVEFPNSDSNMLHNHFKIKVKNGKNKVSFDYYDSNHNYRKGHTELSKEDIINAFDCFISDSLAGDLSFNDFCNEFGYNPDSRKAYKIYKECCKSLEKANKIIEGDIYDFVNEFREANEL